MDDLTDTDDHSLTDLLAALRRATLDRSDPGRLVHDLQVHQLELEIQNRELRDAQQALEESRNPAMRTSTTSPRWPTPRSTA